MRRTAIIAATFFALAAPAGAAVPADGKFKGQTNLGQAVTIKVKDGAIANMLAYVQDTCGATKKPIRIGGPIEIKGDGSFSARLKSDVGTLTMSGRFTRNDVSGRLRAKEKNPLFGQCDTKRVDFDASRS